MERTHVSGYPEGDDSLRQALSAEDDQDFSGDNDLRNAELFLDNEGRKLHPIFDKEDSYLQQRASEPPKYEFSQLTLLHTEQFLKVMEVYQASMKDNGTKGFDLRGKHSWDEVLRIAKDAETAYLKAGGKWYRKAGRFVTANAEVGLPYLRVIPNNFCLSALSGGLRLVLEITAAQLSERRDKVLKTLLRIPHVITQAEHCRETFPEDKVLYDRAEDVYLAALTAIEGTTKWLMQKSAWKPVQALVLGPLYTKSYKEKVQALDETLGALQDRVSSLRDGSIVRAEKIAVNVERVVTDTGQTVSAMTEDIKLLTKVQDETSVKMGHMQDLKQAKEEANRAMKIVLEESNKTAKWMQKNDRAIRRIKFQLQMLEKSATALSRDDLLEILAVPTDSPTRDLQQILRASQSTELSAFDVAQVIVTGEKFQEWQSTDESASLFIEVEGGASSASFRRNGPLSIMSSRLIESLSDMEPALPIYFFCGAHTSSNDPMKGPLGMMRSLICQILRLFSVDLDFASSRRYREQLESLNLDTLCDGFAKIVKRLPLDTVLFCIIDGVSFFEKNEWAKDCQKAISDLQDLASDEELAPVFKLLVTSPLRSKYVGVSFQCCISLSLDDSRDRDGPTDRQLSIGVRRSGRERNFIPSFGAVDWSEEELVDAEISDESDF